MSPNASDGKHSTIQVGADEARWRLEVVAAWWQCESKCSRPAEKNSSKETRRVTDFGHGAFLLFLNTTHTALHNGKDTK